MRAGLLAALAPLLLAACAGPRPCTQALCVARLDGTLETRSWSGTVVSTPTGPKPPVPSDATATMKYGSAEFRHGRTRVLAGEGASFRFAVSTRSVASLEVLSSPVSVAVSTGAPVDLSTGSVFVLPPAR